MTIPTIDSIREAAARLAGRVHETPLLRFNTLGVELKCENLQRAGAFKIRGALNRVLKLSDTEAARGVVAFSSGNHAQGVALAARIRGIPACVLMPEDAVPHKVAATRAYGAEVMQQGVTVHTRGELAARVAKERGATLIPPFDDADIIEGQGTVGLEIAHAAPDADCVVVPLGGGGLLAGVALSIAALCPGARIYGVEPAAGNDGQRSMQAGQIVRIEPPDTIADGARTIAVGERNFHVMQQHVSDVVSVSDAALKQACALLLQRARLVVEPTGALGVAAVMQGLIPFGRRTVVVLSGGNISPELLSEVALLDITEAASSRSTSR